VIGGGNSGLVWVGGGGMRAGVGVEGPGVHSFKTTPGRD
jgi:hypothetical protein